MSEWLTPILEFLKSLAFWAIVNEWQGAILLRRGRFKRVLAPGWHWIWPVIDGVYEVNVNDETTDIGPLPLTTKDDQSITCSAVVKWRVRDVVKFQLKCENAREMLHDAASGALADGVLATCWVDVPHTDFMDRVAKRVRKGAFDYGIEVVSMHWTGISLVQPLVVWNVGTAGHVPPTVLGKAERE